MTSPAPQDFQTSVVPPQAPVTPPQPVSLTDRILIASELGATVEEARTIVGQLRRFERLIFGEVAWEVGAPIPGQPKLTIFAAFNVDFVSNDTDGLDRLEGDCRFYCIPTDGLTDPLEKVFNCFTLNRSFPAVAGEQMTLETFVREVGHEWYNLAVVQGVVEEPDDEDDDEE
jgi:hypothetical protein